MAGEYLRKDVTDNEPGVPLFVDTQVIDVNTCEPVKDIHVEIWRTVSVPVRKSTMLTQVSDCNATGVYSGVVANGNGNTDDGDNIDRTFLRGIQPTDSDGVSLFQSIFPGHYTGRTTHIHVMAYSNATVMPNGTIMNDKVSHVGQMFFDQSLIYEVEENVPYTENTQELLLNAEDSILAEEASTSDPLMNWVYLGKDVKDGILAWLSFGIDITNVRNVTAASILYKEGGVANPDANPGPPPPM